MSRFRSLPSIAKTALHHGGCWFGVTELQAKYPDAVLHLVDGSHGYLVNRLPKQRLVVTVHDVIPALQSNLFFPVPRPNFAARRIIQSSIRGIGRAHQRVFVSSCSRQDYQKISGFFSIQDRIIYPPLKTVFASSLSNLRRWELLDQRPSSTPYVFHLGNNAFYKNRIGVIDIFAMLAQRIPHDLVLAGPPVPPQIRKRLQELGIADRVNFFENPGDEEIKQLYLHASVFIFPSLYEGFGWPPLEAMACGCPVVCSDAGSLAEVVGDAAILCSQGDLREFAVQVENVVRNSDLSQMLRERGRLHSSQFTLDRFAAQLAEVYREVWEGV